jgi:phosphoribosylanthranilate isomerase
MNDDLKYKAKTRSPSERAGVRLKICGMKFQDNIEAVTTLQPDYLGFIFYEKSPRFFDGIIPELPKNIKKTGVFVNASLAYILERVKKYDLQAVQLHGNESSGFCAALKFSLSSLSRQESGKNPTGNDETPTAASTVGRYTEMIEIIKVFSIKDTFNFEVLKPYEAVCDYYLFDTKGKNPGGNGYTFNWEALKNYPSIKPYFLSGGIGLEEVENVLSFLQKQESKYCHTIDINSRFEIKPALKDIEKLQEFIKKLSYLRIRLPAK